MQHQTQLRSAKLIMLLAAIYNLFWGAVISLHPQILLFGNPPTPFLLIILRCVGMLVGVYGIGYWFASRDPQRYWPLVLVGFIGKFLGPFGSMYYIYMAQLPTSFLWINVWNDIVWIIPFGWVIWLAINRKLSDKK